MPLTDRECPACGVAVYRTHHCRGGRREVLTNEQIAANVAGIRARLNGPPPTIVEQLSLDVAPPTKEKDT